MALELTIPEFGESIQEVQIAKWLKQPGDFVEKDEDIVEVETDKASQEIPAPASGVLSEILAEEGDIVGIGEPIAVIEEGRGKDSRAAKKSDSSRPKSKKKTRKKEKSPSKEDDGKKEQETSTSVRVMPAAKRLLSEHGLSAAEVDATGPGGRLLKEDVLRHVGLLDDEEETIGDQPQPDVDAGVASGARRLASNDDEGDIEEVRPMSMIRRRIAQRLVEAQQTAALLTTFNEIDMSAVMDLRSKYREKFQKKYGIKLGYTSFFVRAVVDALNAFPALNAEIRGENIVYRNFYHIGVAVGGGKGLVVPVLRHAQRMGFAEIEQKVADFAARAQQNQIKPSELQGGTFTISNGGVYGSLLSTPIVNPPQSGILGMHAIGERPVARQGQVVICPMMYVALTYDHRIVDGREAVSFLFRIKEVLEEPARMVLEV